MRNLAEAYNGECIMNSCAVNFTFAMILIGSLFLSVLLNMVFFRLMRAEQKHVDRLEGIIDKHISDVKKALK